MAVNARGDVIDPATGQGRRRSPHRGWHAPGRRARTAAPGAAGAVAAPAENTTLGVVATNATLTKAEASLVARMAHDGFARAIAPAHTPSDGDVIFALATGKQTGAVDVGLIGALAADVTAQAIVNAVRHAEPLPSLPSARSLVSVTLALLLVYAAVLILIGWWSSRRATASDFFVAGRSLSPALLAGTLIAANIGAGSTVGAAGLGYRDGIAAWWWVGSAGLGSIVLALVVGPRIWRIAADHDHRTLGDYLTRRFGTDVRALMAVLLWCGSLAILAAQLIALAGLLETSPVCLACGAASSAASSRRCIRGGDCCPSAIVNAVQVFVLVGGLALAMPSHGRAGGFRRHCRRRCPADYWNPLRRRRLRRGVPGVARAVVHRLARVVAEGVRRSGRTRGPGRRDGQRVRAARVRGGSAAARDAARVTHPRWPTTNWRCRCCCATTCPRGSAALALAALFSAEISTADAVLFMLSTSLARDLYAGHLRPDATQVDQLRVVRACRHRRRRDRRRHRDLGRQHRQDDVAVLQRAECGPVRAGDGGTVPVRAQDACMRARRCWRAWWGLRPAHVLSGAGMARRRRPWCGAAGFGVRTRRSRCWRWPVTDRGHHGRQGRRVTALARGSEHPLAPGDRGERRDDIRIQRQA